MWDKAKQRIPSSSADAKMETVEKNWHKVVEAPTKTWSTLHAEQVGCSCRTKPSPH
jgi:hypothetical protein